MRTLFARKVHEGKNVLFSEMHKIRRKFLIFKGSNSTAENCRKIRYDYAFLLKLSQNFLLK